MKLRIGLVILVALLFVATGGNFAAARYLYDEIDPRLAHEKLSEDLQAGTIDFSNFGEIARDKIVRNLQGISFMLRQLGTLQEVCPAAIVEFPNGRKFALRANHKSGKADWVVWVSRNPEVVEDFVLLPARNGPPAILPPLDPANPSPLPSVEVDCLSAHSIQPSNQELVEACRKWPRMC